MLGDTRFGLTAVTDRDDQSNRHGVEGLTETPTAPPAAAAVLAALMVQTMTTPAKQSPTRPMTETAAVVVIQRDGQHVHTNVDADGQSNAMTQPPCPQRRCCDCSHPSECLFMPRAEERPSFAVVWVVGAAVLALVLLLVVAFVVAR